MPDDGYLQYYSNELWKLIPAIYRSLDSDPSAPGPLREIVNRIAGQAAEIRRSMDRLWEDQSIETCDDWVIPYIGDLVDTRLVACMDARAKRLDVANTINYRRRKGTVGLLEELATGVAGHDARVVEFFRRLGRTRHNFDPPIGLVPFYSGPSEPPRPAVIEGLAGAYTRTPMGGYADLRQAYGSGKAQTPFDEFFHTADFRLGRQSVGWHNIPRLGVFVWWLYSQGVEATTPVEDAVCPGQFTFDPTGREIPLFARSERTIEQFGEHWISPDEWELPINISNPLYALQPAQLYPGSMSVLEGSTVPYSLMAIDRAVVNPERGRFRLQGIAPADKTVHVKYHYGFSGQIGAGYDQRLDAKLPDRPAPVTHVTGGGNNLAPAVAGLGAQGTVVIEDSLTYAPPGNVSNVQDVAILGANQERPVVRWTGAPVEWTIQGKPGAKLVIQGLWLAGPNIVLKGEFESVVVRWCTLDPGNSASVPKPNQMYATAVDGQALSPVHLFIEANISSLVIQRSICGPIRVRNGGGAKAISISDSIIQSIPEDIGGAFVATGLFDAGGLADKLRLAAEPVSQFVRSHLSSTTEVDAYKLGDTPPAALVSMLLNDLNGLIAGASIYDATRFAGVRLSAGTLALAGQTLAGQALQDFNRRLLVESFPLELGDVALGTSAGDVFLSRTSVLGPISVHRLSASECILDDIAIAEDEQHGCIRFTAYADGSVVHQPYESVTIPPRAVVFSTRKFGRPDYARLRIDADSAITSGNQGASILTGAENGSEMGAFALEKVPLKKRGLRQKFAEFMPIGMVPVWIDEPVLLEE